MGGCADFACRGQLMSTLAGSWTPATCGPSYMVPCHTKWEWPAPSLPLVTSFLNSNLALSDYICNTSICKFRGSGSCNSSYNLFSFLLVKLVSDRAPRNRYCCSFHFHTSPFSPSMIMVSSTPTLILKGFTRAVFLYIYSRQWVCSSF